MADKKMELHPAICSAFCPEIGLTPSIDYSGVREDALRSYPGAADIETALVYTAKHQEMSITRAKGIFSDALHKWEQRQYAAQWVARYIAAMEYLRSDGSRNG
jgi:hypothetical protein